MANRESQGLQIALILFVMVSVVLAVLTFVFYRSSEEAKRKEAGAQSTLAELQSNYGSQSMQLQYLQHILGATPRTEAEFTQVQSQVVSDAAMKAIDDKYQSDMSNYGEGLPPERRNYGALPEYLIMALKKKNVDNAELDGQVAQLTREKEELEKQEKSRTAEAQRMMDEAKTDLQSEHQTYADARAEVQRREQENLATLSKTTEELRNEKQVLEQQQANTLAELDNTKKTVQTQLDRIAQLVDEPFETPDGVVYGVNQGSRMVWISLGSADGLMRQTTFSIFDQDAMNVAPRRESDEEGRVARKADVSKGKIEVTRVLGAHLAEGRIVDDHPANPIMKGDLIFSPAWKPGRRVRFALAGVIDIDKDKGSDLPLVRSIIAAGGGEIDAEVLKDGRIQGELSAGTRYLVLGDEPTDRDGLNGYGQMRTNAKMLGVQEISLPVLLDLMGYKAESRSVTLGRRRDQRETTTAPAADDNPESEFPERRPPRRSAF